MEYINVNAVEEVINRYKVLLNDTAELKKQYDIITSRKDIDFNKINEELGTYYTFIDNTKPYESVEVVVSKYKALMKNLENIFNEFRTLKDENKFIDFVKIREESGYYTICKNVLSQKQNDNNNNTTTTTNIHNPYKVDNNFTSKEDVIEKYKKLYHHLDFYAKRIYYILINYQKEALEIQNRIKPLYTISKFTPVHDLKLNCTVKDYEKFLLNFQIICEEEEKFKHNGFICYDELTRYNDWTIKKRTGEYVNLTKLYVYQ